MYGIILPIDFHIFQDGYCTTKQMTKVLIVHQELQTWVHEECGSGGGSSFVVAYLYFVAGEYVSSYMYNVDNTSFSL